MTGIYNTMILRETINSFQYKIPVFILKLYNALKQTQHVKVP